MVYKELKASETKILGVSFGIDRKITEREEVRLNKCRKLLKEGKLTVEDCKKVMDKLRLKEDKRLEFKR